MSPEDVPAELVEKGMCAMGMWSKRRDLGERTVRDVLAAVLPEYAVAWDQGYTWGHNDSQNETKTKNPYRAARLTATTEEPTT